MFKQHKLNKYRPKEQRKKEFKFYYKCCDFFQKIFTKHNKYINKIFYINYFI